MDGERIKALRGRANLSRYALAKQTGLSESGLYQIESGKRGAGRETLEALSRVLAKPLKMKPSKVYAELTGLDEKEQPVTAA